jgi:cbb3-type cytochrome oxidase subunit 3
MGRLMNELFHGSPLLAWPILALVLFSGAFLVITVRALRRPAAANQREAALPLDDGAMDHGEDR